MADRMVRFHQVKSESPSFQNVKQLGKVHELNRPLNRGEGVG